MKIIIETIPHRLQKYDTCGDYWTDPDGTMQIRISEMDGSISEGLVALHELAEFISIKHRGIPEQVITEFDKVFELLRKEGNVDEPGFDRNSPYRDDHAAATAIELILCSTLGIPWQEHENRVNNLTYESNANINIE